MEDIRIFDLKISTYDYGRGPGFDVETGAKVTKMRREHISTDECEKWIAATLPLTYNYCTEEGIRNMNDLHHALMHCEEYSVKFGAENMPYYEFNIERIVFDVFRG